MPATLDIQVDQFQLAELERAMDRIEAGVPNASRQAAFAALLMARQKIDRTLDDLFVNYQSMQAFYDGGRAVGFNTESTFRGQVFGGGNPKGLRGNIGELLDDPIGGGIRVTGQRLNLKHYAARQADDGVEYYAGGWKTREGAFIVEKRGGTVWRRKDKRRYPILEQFGPSPAETLSRQAIGASIAGQRSVFGEQPPDRSDVVDNLLNVEMIRFYTDEFDEQFEFILRRGAGEAPETTPTSLTPAFAPALSEAATQFSGRTSGPSLAQQFASGNFLRGGFDNPFVGVN